MYVQLCALGTLKTEDGTRNEEGSSHTKSRGVTLRQATRGYRTSNFFHFLLLTLISLLIHFFSFFLFFLAPVTS